MGLYSRYIFPWIIDRVMARDLLVEERRKVLGAASGRVLEIGFGTGLNLPHYPAAVERLTVIDPSVGMHRRAAARIAASPLEIDAIAIGADGQLPLDDNSFDYVVSTWTMCSIADIRRALAEVHRVLRPAGRLLFVEHGLSPESGVARWQNRLNGINKRIGEGCHLNRNIAALLTASPLRLTDCDEFYLPSTPRIAGWTYRGAAEKTN
ncbi:MAG: class I SAM-dependent methyltransferase [Pirellulales bacterium]